MTEIDRKTQWKGRLSLLGIVMVFVLPMLAAIYLNSAWSDWSPSSTRNHGELVQPVLPLPGHAPADWQRQAAGRWTLLVVRTDCDPECQALMADVLSVHRALGREYGRVQRALVLPRALDVDLDMPQLLIEIDADLSSTLTRHLGEASALYVVDPLGNVMLRYPQGFDPSGLRKDLERLLKYSKVGT